MAERVLRVFLAVVCAGALARADALDDAANQWIKKIQAHLAPDEIARITWNEPASTDAASIAYQNRAKALLARGLQKRVRNPKAIEVAATWSQNLSGYLMIAEIKRDSGNQVEMVNLPRVAAENAPVSAARIEKRLLWTQDTRILDLALVNDDFLVLDTSGLTRYQRRDGKWEPSAKAEIDAPPSRDARGRLTVTGDAVQAEVGGTTCRGNWQTALQLDCQPGGRFVAGRNTIEESGWPPHFTKIEWSGQSLLTETDGQTHIYDAAHKPAGTFEGWGSDLVVITACATPLILASTADNRATDSIALYDLRKREPVRVSDASELPGAVTAMWPMNNGALAVVHHPNTERPNTERYEAYNLTVDCGR